MTDLTAPAVTDDDRKLARKWAEGIAHDMDNWGDGIRTVARVVLDTVPAPVPPTLADMTPGERAACRWMQADVENHSTRYVIVVPFDADAETGLTSAGEGITWVSPDRVTPRPDLPRMTWPGTEKPAPALPEGWRLADHPDNGRVIVTTPARDGRAYYVLPAADHFGFDWHFCDPSALTYIDQEADTSDTVPGSTLAVGSEWEDVDALTRACGETGRDQITVIDKDGDVSVWGADGGWWGTGAPDYGFEPYTILHAGKEADQ